MIAFKPFIIGSIKQTLVRSVFVLVHSTVLNQFFFIDLYSRIQINVESGNRSWISHILTVAVKYLVVFVAPNSNFQFSKMKADQFRNDEWRAEPKTMQN